MTAFLNLLALILPLLGGLALGTLDTVLGAAVAALTLLLASACQGAARLYTSPWDEFHGLDGDD